MAHINLSKMKDSEAYCRKRDEIFRKHKLRNYKQTGRRELFRQQLDQIHVRSLVVHEMIGENDVRPNKTLYTDFMLESEW